MAPRRRNDIRWVAAALVISLVLFFLFPQTRDRPLSMLEAPFVWGAAWVTKAMRGGTGLVSSVWNDYIALHDVRQENIRLQAERDRLLIELSAAEERAQSADRLAALLKFKSEFKRPTVAARVIGTDATHWFRSLLVSKGSFHGITVGDGVISAQGVVGRVAKVTHTTAQILSLNDRGCVIPARIQRSRNAGVLVGGYFQSDGLGALKTANGEPVDIASLAELKYLHRSADVQVGDEVVTSGLGGRFQDGMPLGTVVQVVRDQSETFLKVYVAPHVHTELLEEVLILTGESRKLDNGEF